MLPILLALAFILLLLLVVIAGQPDEFTVTRSAKYLRAAGKDFCARQRSAPVGGVVAVGQTRSELEKHFLRRGRRRGCGDGLGRQQSGRRGSDDHHRE